jgi:hypothetical protein
MLVTDAWLLVAAILLRLEKRPAPRGTGLPNRRRGAMRLLGGRLDRLRHRGQVTLEDVGHAPWREEQAEVVSVTRPVTHPRGS